MNVGTLHKAFGEVRAVKKKMFNTPNLRSQTILEKPLLGGNYYGVVFTSKGNIAMTGQYKKSVILISKDGSIIADSSEMNSIVQIRGIAYHPKLDALLVCDESSKCVIFLDATSLEFKKKVEVPGIEEPHGIAVMSNGSMVVTGYRGPVGVFNTDGKQLKLWKSYKNGSGLWNWPYFVVVDHDDNIIVSDMAGHKIIKLDKSGQFLNEWRTEGWPLGMEVVGNVLLVAQWEPDRVVAYDLKVKDTRLVLSWSRAQYGVIRSVSVEDECLAVLGQNGLRIYKLTEHQ